ncbi:unnamed protein product [Didymodactylos carnosus]|uniref:Uncharacterized protein n=1 Tax=Didymodactylos carnosus TaxID=1234261 RepID=A0A8S2EAM4_9BILA|nr:unnamed protein product [Didymodactylos carnosus]CAF3983711.1 unnamed protein product [Didymodactylos carnosus]
MFIRRPLSLLSRFNKIKLIQSIPALSSTTSIYDQNPSLIAYKKIIDIYDFYLNTKIEIENGLPVPSTATSLIHGRTIMDIGTVVKFEIKSGLRKRSGGKLCQCDVVTDVNIDFTEGKHVKRPDVAFFLLERRIWTSTVLRHEYPIVLST